MRALGFRGHAIAIAILLLIGIVFPVSSATAESELQHEQNVSTIQVNPAAQASIGRYWTAVKMASATPLENAGRDIAPIRNFDASPPPGTPTATPFDGVPTVGALFFTEEGKDHFCSASVVKSLARNTVLTAAHCLYLKGYPPRRNIEYVPGYHDGLRPYGAYIAKTVTLTDGWKENTDINLDFGFVTVAPDQDTGNQVQDVTGGNWLGISLGYDHDIQAIGYPNNADRPVQCATRSFAAPVPSQLQFNCNPFADGTSGGPLMINYDSNDDSGIVIGVIGGYQGGGDFAWTSYSPYFDEKIANLYIRAQLGHGQSVTDLTPGSASHRATAVQPKRG